MSKLQKETIENAKIGVSSILGVLYIYLPDDEDGDMKYSKEISKDEFEFIAEEMGYVKKSKT